MPPRYGLGRETEKRSFQHCQIKLTNKKRKNVMGIKVLVLAEAYVTNYETNDRNDQCSVVNSELTWFELLLVDYYS